jgi:hypothetical protein
VVLIPLSVSALWFLVQVGQAEVSPVNKSSIPSKALTVKPYGEVALIAFHSLQKVLRTRR